MGRKSVAVLKMITRNRTPSLTILILLLPTRRTAVIGSYRTLKPALMRDMVIVVG
jgi:hypothetical protein